MLERVVAGVLPQSYNYKGTKWYRQIQKDHDRFRYNVLFVSYLITSMIPVCSLVYDLMIGKKDLLLNYSLASSAMIIMLLYLFFKRNIAVMTVAAILTAFSGFFLAILLPGDHGAHIVVLFNFIPIVFSITDKRTGAAWSSAFITAIISVLLFFLITDGKYFNLHMNIDYSLIALISVLTMFVIIYSASSQHEKAIRNLVTNIVYDNVTGFPNRDSFERCMKGIDNSIIAIIHITNFKELATIFGYDFSERILINISEILKTISDKKEIRIYKLTWYEFGLQIPFDFSRSHSDAELILREVLRKVRSRKIQWEDKELNLAICIGGTLVKDGNYDDALSKADNALFQALVNNRNIVLHDSSAEIKKTTFDAARKYSNLHDNIINKSMRSYLQSIVDTETGEAVWHESLLMVKSESGIYESVSSYLRTAKSTGLYPLLTEFMLEEAKNHILITGMPVSVNICYADIINVETLTGIKEITGMDGYKSGSLILEIIESEEIDNVEVCIDFIKRVRSFGVRVAIDDFGSGYSNIANLVKFGVDIVKIDGELIKEIGDDDDVYQLIKGVSAFCRSNGNEIVAEFVENSLIHTRIKELNIDFCQGYLFSRPYDPLMN